MAGFTSYDDLISEITVNDKMYSWNFFKFGTAPEAGGVWHSFWTAVGSPGAGAAPATTPGTAHTDEAGSMNFPNQASDQKHLASFGALTSQTCTLMLYDRLVSVSGISVASSGNKTINSAALPRYSGASASNVQAWLEVTTATATTPVVCSLNSYTNEAGTTGRAGGTITFPAAATNLDTLVGPMPLQVGDKGIRSIEVGLNVATAASAGVINVVLLRPLAFLPLVLGVWSEIDLVLRIPSLPRIFDGASLGIAMNATGTTATNIWGRVQIPYG